MMWIRIAGLSAALGALIVSLSAQQNPLVWFPLQPGGRWVYEHEYKSGDRNRPEVDRWTTEEVVTGTVPIPEGLVVLRAVKPLETSNRRIVAERLTLPNGELRELQRAGDAHPSYLVTRDRQPYLVRDNCLYRIAGGWDPQKQELRPSYRTCLAEGTLSPDFCFPLEMGRAWGNNDISWRIEPARTGVDSFLAAGYPEAIHFFPGISQAADGTMSGFKQGVGVVAQHYIHNGAYDEYTKRLVSFSR